MDEWVEETKDTIEKLSQHVDAASLKALLGLYVITDSEEEKQSIRQDVETILGPGLQLLLNSENSFLPVPPEFSGEIRIGTVVQGDKCVGQFAVRSSDLCRHIGIYAQTGHGKSVLLYNLTDQLVKNNVGFWFFDVKQDGRALLSHHEQLMVIPWQQLRWNPLRPPPKMDVKLWWQLFSEVCGHAWGVYHAGINYLLEFLDQLYENYQRTGVFPTLGDLHKLMVASQETSRKRLEYYDVMYNRTRTLGSILGKVLNANGLKLEDLVNRFVVFELDQLRAEEQNWLIEVMLTWLYAYRMTEQHRGERLRQVIICDESHRIWDANKEWRDTTREMGMPTINLFPTQYRDFGTALVLTSQEPSKMTQSVHANTLVKIVGNLGSGTDVNSISEAMGLDDDERDVIHKLKRGEWLVKLSDQYTEPFMIVTGDYPVDKHVSDEAVTDRLRKLLPELEIQDRNEQRQRARETMSQSPTLFKSQLTPDGWGLLANVCQHPFLGIRSRCQALKVSSRRIESAIHELSDRHLIAAIEIPLGRYRPVKFLLPTDDAVELLSSFGYDTSLWKKIGHVGFEHSLYQVLIAYSLRKKGYEATIEKKLASGRRLDVYCNDGKKKTGIEIELTTANIDEKVEGIEELDRLVILVRDEKGLRDGLAFLNGHPAINKVSVQRITEFLRENSTKNSRGTLGTNTFGAEQT